MYPRIAFYDEDVALKNTIAQAASRPDSSQRPNYNWRESVEPLGLTNASLAISQRGDSARTFDLATVAERVGEALTNLLVARAETDIYTDANRAFVAEVTREVARRLAELKVGPGTAAPGAGNHRNGGNGSASEEAPGSSVTQTLSESDLSAIIEKTLIERDAHDVAKSLMMQRQFDRPGESALPGTRVIRRNGRVVPWTTDKVEVAIRKAFLSLHRDSEPAVEVARAVAERIAERGQAFIHIEDVQDLVQEELMRHGHFKVAEAYILYRAQRALTREQQGEGDAVESGEAENQQSMLVVRDRDGSTFFWDGKDLTKRIEFAMIGLELNLDADEIETALRRSLYQEMEVDALRKTVLLNAKSLIERDADFARFAGRILLSYIYEEVLGWDVVRDGLEGLKEAHRRQFRAAIERGIAIERLDPRLREYDLDRLANALDPSADLDFEYLGVQTLYDRYLIVDKTVRPARRLETPQFFWMRVSMGLFLNESEDREGYVTGLYNLYKSRRFCSSTPTLFNSGTLHSQLSSCYLYKVDDNLESIMMRGIAENAFLSKWAGGLGGSWTSVRGTGSYIKGTNGESQGVIPFLKLHNDQLVAVNQGGKRRGSGCAYLETWHNDIEDFLELRRNTGDERRRTHDMNTANWIPDLFMKRVEARRNWTLFRASEAGDLHDLYGRAFEERYEECERRAERGEIWGKSVPAIDLWKKMLKMIFETGHPWITFKDPCNVRSPQDHAGVIHSSNLCTEITLNTSREETAVCNLGSIVLDTHLNLDGSLDHERLRSTIRVAVRALDNVIDLNFYPTEAARRANMRHRPVGLGVMGLQNALYKRGEAFASPEAVDFNDEFMEAIAFYAYEASSDLAAERGTYSSYKGSKWDRGLMPTDTLDLLEDERGERVEVARGGRMDWQPLRDRIARQGMRNSNVLAIAPTATISNIMGTTPCIEPAYRNLYVKSNLSGDFVVLNRQLVLDLKDRGLWSQQVRDDLKYFDGELEPIDGIPDDLKRKYLTAFGIESKWFLEAAARRQKWIDQSQSVNLFLGKPDLKTLSHTYRAAWRMGLKTTYYLRTLGASNIEKATVSRKKEVRGHAGQGSEAAPANPAMAALPSEGSPVPGAEERERQMRLEAERSNPALPGMDDSAAAPRSGPEEAATRKFTDEEKRACSLDAYLNGGECEACQ